MLLNSQTMICPAPIFESISEVVLRFTELKAPDMLPFVSLLLRTPAFHEEPECGEVYSLETIQGALSNLAFIVRSDEFSSPFNRKLVTLLVLCAIFRRREFARGPKLRLVNMCPNGISEYVKRIKSRAQACAERDGAATVRIVFDESRCPIFIAVVPGEAQALALEYRRCLVQVLDTAACKFEILRALQKGGEVVVLTPDAKWFFDDCGIARGARRGRATIVLTDSAEIHSRQALLSVVQRCAQWARNAPLLKLDVFVNRAYLAEDRWVKIGGGSILHSPTFIGEEFLLLTPVSLKSHFGDATVRITRAVKSASRIEEVLRA